MGIPYQYVYSWGLRGMQHEYRSTPIYEYLCEFPQYPVYYTLGIININQLCVLGIDANKHRQKGCSKNEVISFLLQPFYIFFLCLDYTGTLVKQNRRVLFVKASYLSALINQNRCVLILKASHIGLHINQNRPVLILKSNVYEYLSYLKQYPRANNQFNRQCKYADAHKCQDSLSSEAFCYLSACLGPKYGTDTGRDSNVKYNMILYKMCNNTNGSRHSQNSMTCSGC